MIFVFFQVYGEEIEYADDILGGGGPPGPPPMSITRRSSKKVKSASGDSSSTSPERNRRDDIAIDIEIERGGSGAGLSCGSTGGLESYQDNANHHQAVNALSNMQQIHQIRDQRMERHQLSQDHWQHKSHSPISTAHASVIGAGVQPVNRIYSTGRYGLKETTKNADFRAKKNVTPSPILKYLKIKVSVVSQIELVSRSYKAINVQVIHRKFIALRLTNRVICNQDIIYVIVGWKFVPCSVIDIKQKRLYFERRSLHRHSSCGLGTTKVRINFFRPLIINNNDICHMYSK